MFKYSKSKNLDFSTSERNDENLEIDHIDHDHIDHDKSKPKIIKIYISNLFQKNIKTQESIAWEHFSSRRQYTRQKGT